ncbi:MAG: hypothetical protein RR653_14160, partial [Clostridia bacterium]
MACCADASPAELACCADASPCGIGILHRGIPLRGESRFCGNGFPRTGVGTAPHTGTYSFGAKEYAENSGT